MRALLCPFLGGVKCGCERGERGAEKAGQRAGRHDQPAGRERRGRRLQPLVERDPNRGGHARREHASTRAREHAGGGRAAVGEADVGGPGRHRGGDPERLELAARRAAGLGPEIWLAAFAAIADHYRG